ncbi:hypothetical protein SNEBB_001835 [Seison nebaliae]|nr:hypothetical protein SNEBB_001835 [Seison nebaliae]
MDEDEFVSTKVRIFVHGYHLELLINELLCNCKTNFPGLNVFSTPDNDMLYDEMGDIQIEMSKKKLNDLKVLISEISNVYHKLSIQLEYGHNVVSKQFERTKIQMERYLQTIEEKKKIQKKLFQMTSNMKEGIYHTSKHLEKVNMRKTFNIRDLLRYSKTMALSYGIYAPHSWGGGDQRRPFPLDLVIRDGNLFKQSSLLAETKIEENDENFEKQMEMLELKLLSEANIVDETLVKQLTFTQNQNASNTNYSSSSHLHLPTTSLLMLHEKDKLRKSELSSTKQNSNETNKLDDPLNENDDIDFDLFDDD